MDQSILATVNINIGLGRDNPSLIIRKHDNIDALIHQIINKYQLPDKVFQIIMERVSQELEPAKKVEISHPIKQEKRTLSSTRSNKTVFIKKSTQNTNSIHHTPNAPSTQNRIYNQHNKENHKYDANIQKESRSVQKKSLSPIARTPKSPNVRKIEIKPSPKPTPKTELSNIKPQSYSTTLNNKSPKPNNPTSPKLLKLFKHLTKCNPPNLKILSPDYINLKGMDRGLLCQLQEFFEQLQENQFDKMTESYFQEKVIKLGFKDRFSKKQYDYCYLHA